ncbi:cytochrome P450 6B5-like [Cydia pomonella]|uniref:cytochrome P450 6B5-like n=1 Tax=Cydia pomonella TaxID=82600 RepID=UPI002ADD96E5|nr:cytochrome P450 6B5-like [Cydia pomonella]
MPVILAATVIIIITLLYIHFTKHNDGWIEKSVPGPEPTFIFGNVEDAVLRRKHIGIVFKNIHNAYSEEKVLGIFVMKNPELLIRDLDVVRNILTKDFDFFIDRGVEFENNLGADLLHDENTRGMVRSRFYFLFTRENLQNMMHLLIEKGNAFVEHVDQITQSKQEQDVHGLVHKFTQASIACALGVNLDTFDKEYDTLLTNQKATTFNFGRELELMYPSILNKLRYFFLPKKNSFFLYKLVQNFISQRTYEPRNKKDFMDLILKLIKEEHISEQKRNGDTRSSGVTDEMIAAQAYIYYALGNETIASTLGFLLYQLALNPDIQDKVVTEIKEMLENHNKEITVQGILDLSYMGKVLDETLRMYPVVPYLRRKSTKKYMIPDTNLKIENGEFIRISVLGIHYDKKIYPTPDVFDPERFSPENVAARHECSYLPFGLDPGHCIAKSFAQVVSRVCLVKLLSQFRVEPSDNTPRQVEYDSTRTVLYPKGSFLIHFVKRKDSH